MARFFVEPAELQGDYLSLAGENAAHAKVLRLKIGEEVLVCDGQGKECICSVSEINGGRIELKVNTRQDSSSEARVKASVYMAFPKADKLEHVIQKATELGVYEIVTFPTSRCVSKPDEKSLKKKLERWQKIAASAAEQSGRGRIPEVIVLGGGVSAAGGFLADCCQRELERLFSETTDPLLCTVRIASHQNDAGIIGAALLAGQMLR